MDSFLWYCGPGYSSYRCCGGAQGLVLDPVWWPLQPWLTVCLLNFLFKWRWVWFCRNNCSTSDWLKRNCFRWRRKAHGLVSWPCLILSILKEFVIKKHVNKVSNTVTFNLTNFGHTWQQRQPKSLYTQIFHPVSRAGPKKINGANTIPQQGHLQIVSFACLSHFKKDFIQYKCSKFGGSV